MVLEKVKMSSRQMTTNWFILSPSTLLTRALKTTAALMRLNDMTKYGSWPVGVLKVVFHSSPF